MQSLVRPLVTGLGQAPFGFGPRAAVYSPAARSSALPAMRSSTTGRALPARQLLPPPCALILSSRPPSTEYICARHTEHSRSDTRRSLRLPSRPSLRALRQNDSSHSRGERAERCLTSRWRGPASLAGTRHVHTGEPAPPCPLTPLVCAPQAHADSRRPRPARASGGMR